MKPVIISVFVLLLSIPVIISMRKTKPGTDMLPPVPGKSGNNNSAEAGLRREIGISYLLPGGI